MNRLLLLVPLVLAFSACAPEKHVSTQWDMSWKCYTNYCYSHISPNGWGGSGSFDSQDSCLTWETGFLNTAAINNGGAVSACTGN